MQLSGWCTCSNKAQHLDLLKKERKAFSEMYTSQASSGEAKTSSASAKALSESTAFFPLMDLPVEIRIIIYRFHFLQPSDDRTGGPLINGVCLAGDCCPLRRCNGDVPVRMLFMASRAVYEEAMPLYFQTKTFQFFYTGLSSILSTIGPRHHQHISKIVFVYGSVKTSEDFPLLKDCPALKELTILINDVP